MRQVKVPKGLVSIVEGESLLNDATALANYASALTVAAGSVFSPASAVVRFTATLLGGIVVGLLVGWVIARIRTSLQDTPVEMTISLLTPYAAFLPAERFGLPLLEAMACGCPVVAYHNSSLPEVAGDAALLVPDGDADALGRAAAEVAGRPETAERLRLAGLTRARRFTWRRAARATIEAYRRLLS